METKSVEELVEGDEVVLGNERYEVLTVVFVGQRNTTVILGGASGQAVQRRIENGTRIGLAP